MKSFPSGMPEFPLSKSRKRWAAGTLIAVFFGWFLLENSSANAGSTSTVAIDFPKHVAPRIDHAVNYSPRRIELSRADRERIWHETRLAIQTIQNYHYSSKPFTFIDAGELLASYMQELDYHRLFFTQTDEEHILLRFETSLMNAYVVAGSLFPAIKIFEIYRDRARARIDWIFNRLEEDSTFDSDELYTHDRSEASWPRDEAEADNLWNKRLKFELLQELLNDETTERAKEKVVRRYRRNLKHVEEFDILNIQELFLTTLANLYDPHSNFLSSDTLEDFAITMRNSLVGIGALLREEDGYCTIQELIPGGPAELSNSLHPGDAIVAVAQPGEEPVDVIDMKLRKIVNMIRGEKGTRVILTVIPADASDSSDRIDVVLKRNEIQLTKNLAEAEIYAVPYGDDGMISVGVIDLPGFYGSGIGGKGDSSTTEDVENLIKKLQIQGIDGLVLDLRRNGGGLLNEAIALTGLFIPKGPVVQIRDTNGSIRKDWDKDPKVAYEGPLVVLVSRRSASASEIVAGALQNHGRALIVGDSATHGKGTVQAIFELDRNMGMSLFKKNDRLGATKITIQKFYLPNGDSTQNHGVHSDIVIPSINEYLELGESDLDNALVWDSIDALQWNAADTRFQGRALVDRSLIDSLRRRSRIRQDALPEFSYLDRNLAWFKAKQEETEVSLNLSSRRQQKQRDISFKESMEKMRKELNQHGFTSKTYLLDVALAREAEHQEKLRSTLLPNGRPKQNQYYQKIFYYEPEENGPIEKIWVENFDYEKIFRHASEVAAHLSAEIGVEFETEVMKQVLGGLKNAYRSSDFLIDRHFEEHFGDMLPAEQIDALIPKFFFKLIAIDPEVIADRSALDIHLRESLRIVSDWLSFERGRFEFPEVAAKIVSEENDGLLSSRPEAAAGTTSGLVH